MVLRIRGLESISTQLGFSLTWAATKDAARRRRHSERLQFQDRGQLASLFLIWLLTAIFSAAHCRTASAYEIDFPEIDPTYAIHVTANTVAEERQGSYQVLAFAGNCEIKQGTLTAKAREIVLWIERVSEKDVEHPGKAICYLNGQVVATWGAGRELRDHQWMVRLFSVHPVLHEAQPVTRYDIPSLDWSREASSVELAQFMQTEGRSGAVLNAPPLLQPGANSGNDAQPQQTASSAAQSTPTIVPISPGAVEWNPASQAGTSKATSGQQSVSGSLTAAPQTADSPSQSFSSPPSSASVPSQSIPPPSAAMTTAQTPTTTGNSLFPSGGLVIPDGGADPYPAAGSRLQGPEEVPLPSAAAAPNFPQPEAQVVRQIPAPSPFNARSVQFLPRSSINPQITISPFNSASGESVVQITGGFKMVAQGIQVAGSDGAVVEYGTVSLEADNAVVWLHGNGAVNPLEGLSSSTPERPIELYLDGNIVFSQGNRVVYADRMYYNVSSEYGMVLSAEVLTPVPQYQGLLRLKADVIQQRDSRNFKAFGAAVTSSRLGVPRYWLQSGDVEFQDYRTETDLSVFAPTDANRPTNMQATAKSNLVYLGGLPVFYWPTFSTNLKKPSFYLTGLRFANDDIFGFQTYADVDLFHLLGIQAPQGTDFDFSVDYLSKRGPAFGTDFSYQAPTWLFGVPGRGYSNSWFIYDEGLDTLGSDRVNMVPEQQPWRGRSISFNRLYLSPNWELMLETGFISDRNFLEQFFENEWEQQKDYSTALRIRRYNGNRLFDLYGQVRVNDFFTETESLPRLEHYWLGQDLWGQRLTWNAATSVGYVHQKVASTPTAPQDAAKFQLQPWETDSEGLRAITRQELNLPFALGNFKFVPFMSGEAGFWNEDVNQDDVTRLTGQAGVRTSLPFWRAYPNVENRLLDLRGLAHKITLDAELFYADSNQDLDRFPQYDSVDDNSQEHFRRRFVFNTFGGTLPPQFDERGYAYRTGMQRWVAAGSKEIVDDLTQLRIGANQRLQTKRGLPGRERIVDLVSLYSEFSYFPKAEEDNFGEDFGNIKYDFRYHVGDRLVLLSDGYFDVFSQGLKAISAGAQVSRPGRGEAYIGFLSLEGPISANILNGFVTYRLNEKWIFNGGAAFDFGSTGNIGQNLALTRIGESALIRMGVNIDSGRDNVIFNFNIEPRFLPTVRLGAIAGELIPPAGLFGLE